MQTVPEKPVDGESFKKQVAYLVVPAQAVTVVDGAAGGYATSLFSAMTVDPVVGYQQPTGCANSGPWDQPGGQEAA